MYKDPSCAKTVLDCFKFKRLEKIKTEQPFILPQESIAERLKKDWKTGTGVKILTQNKLLTRLPVLLTQTKIDLIRTDYKRKSDKHHIFCINIIKSLKHFTTV